MSIFSLLDRMRTFLMEIEDDAFLYWFVPSPSSWLSFFEGGVQFGPQTDGYKWSYGAPCKWPSKWVAVGSGVVTVVIIGKVSTL